MKLLKPLKTFVVICVALVGVNSSIANASTMQRVAILAKSDKPRAALAALKQVEKSKTVANDLIQLTYARLYFQTAELDKALAAYNKISPDSDFWLESVEEKAHVMGRKGEYASAISFLKTVTAVTFDGVIGPEPYFVEALTHLKICNYSEIFKVTERFKKRFKNRLADLAQLAKAGDSASVQHLIALINEKSEIAKSSKLPTQLITNNDIGYQLKHLPRNISRDMIITSQSQRPASAKRDQAIRLRVRDLAKSEIKEIEDTISKLQIIEAEVVQRIYLAEKSKAVRPSQSTIVKNSDVLVFPVDSDEVWLDELDSYAAKVEKCLPASKRVSL
jgi:tetratricopeptide (TPR) repeat protein